MRFTLNLLCCLVLTGCATYGDSALQPGQSTTTRIEQRLGPPALRWSEASGGETLVYPTGPMGYHTWFFRTNAENMLIERKNVLNSAHFAKIQAGMSEEEVLRVIGPPYPAWTVYFKARDELVWEWRYCDDWNEPPVSMFCSTAAAGAYVRPMPHRRNCAPPWISSISPVGVGIETPGNT